MNNFKISTQAKKILVILIMLTQFSEYAQGKKVKMDQSFIVPLEIGKNPAFQYKSLKIDPVNLFVDSDSTHIQLELKLTENNNLFSTFLRCYKEDDSIKINYPKAFKSYIFNLDINKEKIGLIIEKLDFGTPFFVDLKQKISIGDMILQFNKVFEEWSEDPDGNQIDSFNSYEALLFYKDEEKKYTFINPDRYAESSFFYGVERL